MWIVPAFVYLITIGPAAAGQVHHNQQSFSPALGEDIAYTIYLPDGHGANETRYPVIYLLHGYGGGQREWFHGGRLEERLDSMIAAGTIPPVIAVTPAAGKSWYVDSAQFGGPGNFHSAIVEDLIEIVDQAYATQPNAEFRAIAGISMGGHGALRLAFAHPDRFNAVAALSPAIWKPDGVSWTLTPQFRKEGSFEKWFPRTTGERFDLATLNAQSPFSLVDDLSANTLLPRIMLTVGDDDYWKLHDGTVELYLDLRAAGLSPELRVSNGGHNWRHWRDMVDPVLVFLSQDWLEPEPTENPNAG